MSEVALLEELARATESGKLSWERLLDPLSFRAVARLPKGTSFELSTSLPTSILAAAQAERVRAVLYVRDKQDRVMSTIVARIALYPSLLPSAVAPDGGSVAMLQLVRTVRAKMEEPIEETLTELKQLGS